MSRRMRWARHVVQMGKKKRKAYVIGGKTRRKKTRV
jgi:hypothetical protein